MNYIDCLNIFIKYLFINIFTCYINFKISNYKFSSRNSKLLVLLVSSILSAIFTFCSIFFNPSYMLILSYIILSILFFYITRYSLNYSIITTFLSLAITLILYVASMMVTIFIRVPFPNINRQNPILIIIAMLLEAILIYCIFKIKRFKNGLSFLKDKNYNYDIILFLSELAFLIYVYLGNYLSISISVYCVLVLTVVCLSIFMWIKEKITLHYRNLLTKDTIETLQNQLDEQITINENMKKEVEKLSKINHKYSSRIHALELYVAKLSNKLANDENISDNILESKKLINRLSTEFSNELKIDLKNDFLINKTGIINIDNILEYFYLECSNKNISFNVIIKNNIKDSVNNAIPLNLLETLIADMIKNSIIAIGYSSNKNPKILVQFDNTDCFEFRIYDTGIEFELDTLVTLGKERITTHKDDGGSGIGFVATFETLEETNGSFIIEEYPANNDNFKYSKCLIFKFDNKGKYIIRSYRSEEIRKNCNNELLVQQLL